jgi:ATP-dependent helicase/nuclease subunit A
VTAKFDRGEVVGYIDHLLVTPSTYHVIDYKTGDVSEDEVTDDVACYVERMHAYAVALAKQDPTRSVRISLVFTAIDADWTTELEPAEIESIEERTRTPLLAEALEENGCDASRTQLLRVKRTAIGVASLGGPLWGRSVQDL